MDAIDKASVLILYSLLTAAVISDIRFGRVSNRLIVAGLAVSAFLRGYRGGVSCVLGMLPNILIPVILLFLFFVCGALGAGDIKLFSMIGGFLELHRLIRCIGISMAAGAVWSLGILLCHRNFFASLQRVFSYGRSLLQGQFVPYEQPDQKNRICFTVAILVGTILSGL